MLPLSGGWRSAKLLNWGDWDSIGNPLRGLHLGELSSYDDVFSLSKNGELHPEN